MQIRHLALIISLLAPQFAIAETPKDWEATVRQFDTAYWDAYNRCDVIQMARMNTEDLEFYHDAGGAMLGNDKFVAAMKNNICARPDVKVRREAIAASVQVYPMRTGDKLYGAVIQGEHQFYNGVEGHPEQRGSRARFSHLLLLKDGVWKVARVLSFDHAAAVSGNARSAVALTTVELDRHTGEYAGAGHPPFLVKRVGDDLTLSTEGKTFTLAASGPDAFFLRDRDVTATFTVEQPDGRSKVTIREQGKIVAEGIRAH